MTEEPFDPYQKWLQIPKHFRPPTHFQLLGIPNDETDSETIQEASLMRIGHVRHFQGGPHAIDANRILNELAEATDTLLDPTRRRKYRERLSENRHKSTNTRKQAAKSPPQIASASESPQSRATNSRTTLIAIAILLPFLLIASLFFHFLRTPSTHHRQNIATAGQERLVPRDFPTIQEAISASQTGDTVLLQPGEYREAIILREGVSLVGATEGDCYLLPPAKHSTIVFAGSAGNLTLKNLEFDGKHRAIRNALNHGVTLQSRDNDIWVVSVAPECSTTLAVPPLPARLISLDGRTCNTIAEYKGLLYERSVTSPNEELAITLEDVNQVQHISFVKPALLPIGSQTKFPVIGLASPSSGINLQNCTFHSFDGPALTIESGPAVVTMADCEIRNCSVGVAVHNARLVQQRCHLRNCDKGVVLQGAKASLEQTDGEMEAGANQFGMLLSDNSRARLERCRIAASSIGALGIGLHEGSAVSIDGTAFDLAGLAFGIKAEDDAKVDISNSQFIGGYALTIKSQKGRSISKATIANSTFKAIGGLGGIDISGKGASAALANCTFSTKSKKDRATVLSASHETTVILESNVFDGGPVSLSAEGGSKIELRRNDFRSQTPTFSVRDDNDSMVLSLNKFADTPSIRRSFIGNWKRFDISRQSGIEIDHDDSDDEVSRPSTGWTLWQKNGEGGRMVETVLVDRDSTKTICTYLRDGTLEKVEVVHGDGTRVDLPISDVMASIESITNASIRITPLRVVKQGATRAVRVRLENRSAVDVVLGKWDVIVRDTHGKLVGTVEINRDLLAAESAIESGNLNAPDWDGNGTANAMMKRVSVRSVRGAIVNATLRFECVLSSNALTTSTLK